MSISFQVADKSHDLSIRRFFTNHPSEGDIDFKLKREPSCFDALEVEGTQNEILLAMDEKEIVGVATRSEKKCFLNKSDSPQTLGYLSNLKLNKKVRNNIVLARGYQHLKKIHERGKAKLYLTTILSDNHRSKSILTSGRAGLPHYEKQGEYVTTIIHSSIANRINSKSMGITTRSATHEDIAEILSFFAAYSKTRQFFPAYQMKDLTENQGLLKGLNIHDITLAKKDNKIVGTLADWNQCSYRSWSIQINRIKYKFFRKFLNLIAPIRGLPRIPKRNQSFPYRILGLPCIKDDNCHILERLLFSVSKKHASSPTNFLIGAHERDPLNTYLKGLPSYRFTSSLYVVFWPDGIFDYKGLLPLIPYLELGGL